MDRAARSHVGDRLAQSALRVSVAVSPLGATLLLVVGLAASWSATHLLGGANGVVPHFYYLPIVFAAVRFGPAAAFVVALVSGLLAGPLTYLDVDAGTAQELSRWGTRALFFVVVGLVMAGLVRPSLPTITEELRRARAEKRLRQAISDGELFLRYQPIVSLETGRVRAVEALVRWQHPVRGELAPAAFLPTAEESEVIHALGAFVVASACQQAARWQRERGVVEAPVVSVNMSARELDHPGLVSRVQDCLERSGLDPSLLCIEITESTLVSDTPTSIARLTGLKELGLRLAVDDFGTGYSSLSSVHRFPLDVLKVDRSFVAPIGQDAVTEEVLWGLVVLAQSLSLTTVAEGVETHEHDRVVSQLGYHLGQGYHYAKPMTVAEIDRLLAEDLPLRPPSHEEERGEVIEPARPAPRPREG